ncbi:MAG: TRAP transporter small permease [Alphaproteobacteria bacterium]|nr:TRAP transporter small permease [Alphaproteobacteria bacterium]
MSFRAAATALSRCGAVVGAAALTVMIVLITVQVASRQILAAPMVIADEVSGYLLVVTTFSALGYALHRGDHIQVTLVTDRLSPRARAWLRILWCLVGVPFLALLVRRTADMAWDSYVTGSFSVSATNVILWPIQAFVPLGLAVFLIQMLAELAAAVDDVRGKRP